jgi:sugar phosphate isomerase/epimerase
MKGLDLSIHSGTAGVFQPYESFTKANLSILIAEIDVCCFLGARQFVFHLNDGYISNKNKKRLKDVLAYATDLGIEMLYESNSILVAEYAYDVLGSFPELGYVLDLGHLNNGIGSGELGSTIDDFIFHVKDRVVYVHASNNNGLRDEHNDLDNGTLDWRHVFRMLDISKIQKIIIEVSQPNLVEDSKKALMRHFNEEHYASSSQPVKLDIAPYQETLTHQRL